MDELLEIAQGLENIVVTANSRLVGGGPLCAKSDFEILAKGIAPKFEFTGDDWMEELCQSETASIALTKRDNDGNIVKTGIATLYRNFPIVVADKTGCYIYRRDRIIPVVSMNGFFVDNLEIPIKCHIFGQKSTSRWVWMNEIIGFLNGEGIRTSNSMGPYFVLRNFFYHYRETDKGIVIIPMKAVISEPFSVKPKAEIGAFVINALNYGLPDGKKFALTNISGEKLFHDGKIEKVKKCKMPYCAAGWVAGPNKELVLEVLFKMKSAVNAVPSLYPNRKTIELTINLKYL